LLGCRNGVIDLSPEGQGKLRPGCPEDMISMSTHIDFKPLYQCDPAIVAEINGFYRKQYMIDDVLEMNWQLRSSLLHGSARNEMLFNMHGPGGNGKSKDIKLTVSTLGDYAKNCNSTILTGEKPKPGSHNADAMQLRGLRAAFFEELQNQRIGDMTSEPALNDSTVKEYTGNGAGIACRGAYGKEMINFNIHATMILSTNGWPKFKTEDEGMDRRMVCIVHPTRYKKLHEFRHTNMFHMRRDEHLDDKIMYQWPPTYLAMLVDNYMKTCHKPLTLPADVLLYTRYHREMFDEACAFRRTCLIDMPESKQQVTARQIYQAYCRWVKTEKRGNKERTIQQFIRNLTRLYTPIQDNYEEILFKGMITQVRELKFRGIVLVTDE
jgi:putative DNA primase/helicase